MWTAWRGGVLALLFFAVPMLARADVSSLVWGDVVMLEGGTYKVQLGAQAPSYVTGPETTPDGEWVFGLYGTLYAIDSSGTREYVETFNQKAFDDPDDPSDGDPLFAWPSAGSYELDMLSFPPPQPMFLFENHFINWLAKLVLGETAYAQFGEPIFLGTIHFTIEDGANSVPDPVIIIPGILGSEQHNGEWIIDPILHTYDDLIATLDENGYTPGVDLFPFPYNWRKSNVETALLLKKKIDEVKGVCSCTKVDLVAHSMGGLVARQYIQSDAYEHDVDQLIFLGTPHLGAPKAYLMWEGGEVSAANDLFDELLERLLEHEASEEGYISLFNYIRTEPIESVRELLPTYSYIFDGSNLRQYPDNYPRNLFLENLNNNIAQLLSSEVEIHNIIGDIGTPKTISGIQATNKTTYIPRWVHGYPEGFYDTFGDHGLILGNGDTTVPLPSASFIGVNLTSTSSIHSALPLTTQPAVFHILTGKNPTAISQDYAGLDLINLIFIKILSPADLLVIAPDGKKIGKDFNGQEVNGIPNAFYTGFTTDTEFITILNPLDGKYKIYTQGTGSGSYTVEVNMIDNATTTKASFTGNTAPGITSQLNLEVVEGDMEQGSLGPVVTYESTLADLDRIYALKWMNVGVYKSLKAQLQAAKKAQSRVAKALLKAMLKQLDAYRGKLLNEQGYKILKADIERLINN